MTPKFDRSKYTQFKLSLPLSALKLNPKSKKLDIQIRARAVDQYIALLTSDTVTVKP